MFLGVRFSLKKLQVKKDIHNIIFPCELMLSVVTLLQAHIFHLK